MDLELGLKITRTIDDHVSSANFRIAKDKSGPIFLSKETQTTFILTVTNLKGYRREHVDIDINEDGTQIAIWGEKPVQEKVMSGWIMYKKEVEMRGFNKVFRIPEGVVLDRIKAKFNEHESTLTIGMPKSEKGIRGVGIEEVKQHGADIGRHQTTQPAADEGPENDGFREENEEESGEHEKRKMEENGRVKGKGQVDEEGSKEDIVTDRVAQRKESKKSASRKRDDPKIVKVEEADGIEKEKVGGNEIETEQIIADKEPKIKTIKDDKSTQVSHEVTKPSQQTQVITKQDTQNKASELPELEEQTKKQEIPVEEREEPKADLEEHVGSRQESSEASKPVGDTIPAQQEAQVQQIKDTDGIREEGDVDQLQKQEPIKEPSHGDEIEEEKEPKNEEHVEVKTGVDMRESSEKEKENKLGEKSSDEIEKKPDVEKSNLLCSPFIIAGSALIVSFLMLAINRIRTRKR